MAVETHKGRITTFLESIIPFMNTKKNTIIIKKHYRGQPFKYCFLSLRAWGVPPQLITHGLIIQGWHYYAWPPSISARLSPERTSMSSWWPTEPASGAEKTGETRMNNLEKKSGKREFNIGLDHQDRQI